MRVALSRVAWSVRERMILRAQASLTPRDLINTRIVSNILMSFFLTSQLSQFMEQINPLAELTHLRRVSRLGPGGLTRETAGLEVRDVHYSHYGRICPIETPEGPNIGIISSLASYARVNEYGFIETPYRKVENGRVKAKIQYLTADEEDIYTIAQANAPVDKNGKFLEKRVLSRKGEDFPVVPPGEVEYMDISPRQLVSISTALIPFLEHDDANRALMGSNMQRQAVPLLFPEAPLVGTGIEAKVASDSASVITVRRNGRVMAVTGELVVIEPDEESIIPDIYRLVKFSRTNQDTCVNQYPIVRAGDYVHKGDVIIDGAATDKGELALGRNILVAFMPWRGYNFEDAIVISERLLKDDAFTSIHIEEFDADVRDTKLGPEEITREIPNVSEELLKDLDENGIIRVGAEVGTDDILVGKVSPKGEAELTPEEKLIRAIFGEKATDVKDTSLRVPPGVTGVVQDVIVLSRKSDDPIYKEEVERRVKKIKEGASYELKKIKEGAQRRIKRLIVGKRALAPVKTKKGEVVVKKRGYIPANIPVEKLSLDASKFCDAKILETLKTIYKNLHKAEESVKEKAKREIERALSGDDVPQGVLKIVRVFLAERRTISVGDKLSGRHGNKGTVAKIVPEEDMPYLPDGTPIDMALNPLGVPSRMNVGQILETSLGWAAKKLGISVACPVFEGATIEEIKRLLKEADLPENGKTILYDGKTGKPFENEITVGYIYMMKLAHMVSDKIHARSIGSYSLITQQPLGGKAQFGGQRFGEMEVWALEAYGAAYTLQEMLTVKSDDVPGRKKLYECIVKGENLPEPGLPASFNVLLKELNGLCLEPSLIKQ
jgi:DNA-directed RNA polymerase subunit beta